MSSRIKKPHIINIALLVAIVLIVFIASNAVLKKAASIDDSRDDSKVIPKAIAVVELVEEVRKVESIGQLSEVEFNPAPPEELKIEAQAVQKRVKPERIIYEIPLDEEIFVN